MIKLNGMVVEQNHFPDGTLLMKHPLEVMGTSRIIDWYYENDAELFTIICLRKQLGDMKYVYLNLPYIPHARMDRVKNPEDVFTLKYFCDTINQLDFAEVHVLDPHSNVASALLDRVVVETPKLFIEDTINRIYNEKEDSESIMAFFPDEGAMKRYSDETPLNYAFGIKKRDWKTGKILGLDLAGAVDYIKGRDVLIIDDICSRGGTFYHSAKALKEAGARNVYLYVTHCENTILEGEVLTSGLIEKVYTTNSIFTKGHEKVEVIEI